MADELSRQAPEGRVVGTGVLQQALYSQWRNANAFGGLKDPTQIWSMMMREDGSAIPLYRELEDKDDDVSSALEELTSSVLGREWDLQPGDDSQAAMNARDEVKAQLTALDTDTAFETMLAACGYGFVVQELMFDASEGQARLVSIDDCPQEMFLFGPRLQPQVGALQMLSNTGASSGELVPEEKFIVFSYRGRARSRMGRPLLRLAFWPSWFKRQCLGLWLKAGAKANGTALARYADGAGQAEINLALEIADALVEGVAFAAPQTMEIDTELLKAAKSTDVGLYEKLFEKSQYSIARAIKGETLTSFGNESGRGSNAQGQTHQETFDQRSVSLAKKHARVMNDLCRRLTLWNFGPNVLPPVFGWDIAEEEDLVWKSTWLANAQRLGISLGAKWAAQQLRIPAIGEGDVALVPNVTAAAVTPPTTAFAETDDAVRQAAGDLAELDKLTAQLRGDASRLLQTRIGEVADRLMPKER